jgi:uncharacterized protein (TIGR02453 family)
VVASRFEGFRPEALSFLVELALNNDRAWFQPRKAEYETLLKHPLEELCVALDEELRALGVPLTADRRSQFRIYRDVRFSKDKSPYKTNIGASFPWRGQGGGVGGYLHVEPGESYMGGGMWHPQPQRLAAWRSAVTGDRAKVHAALEDPRFQATFGAVNGESLKRAPAGFSADDPDIELLKLKDVVFGRPVPEDELFSADLPRTLAATLADAVPVLELLAGLPDHETGAPWLRD